jgi:hypothetical protein
MLHYAGQHANIYIYIYMQYMWYICKIISTLLFSSRISNIGKTEEAKAIHNWRRVHPYFSLMVDFLSNT